MAHEPNQDPKFSLPSERDPVLGRNGSPLGYLQLGAEALAPSNIKSFAQPAIDSLTDTGLGLGRAIGQGVEAVTPSPNTLERIFLALEAGGAAQQGRSPLWMQMREQQQNVALKHDAMLLDAENQRKQYAMKMQEMKLKQDSEEWDRGFGMITNPNVSPSQQMAFFKEQAKNSPIMAKFAHGVNEKLIAQVNAVADYLPLKPAVYMENLKNGSMTFDDVANHAQIGQKTKDYIFKNVEEPLIQEQALVRVAAGKPATSPESRALALYRAEQTSKQAEAQAKAETAVPKAVADLDIAEQNVIRGTAPIVSPGMPNMAGQVEHIVTDPVTGKQRTTTGVAVQRTQTEDIPKVTLTDAAKIAALNTGVKDIDSLKQTIIAKDGTVNRQTLFTGKVFGGLPFTHGKDIDRWILDMVQTKFRLETGSAARPDEEATMMRRFAPKVTDPDSTIAEKLDDLKNWHLDTLNVYDPTGILRGRLGGGSRMGEPVVSRQEAFTRMKKLHPGWSREQIFEEMHKQGVR